MTSLFDVLENEEPPLPPPPKFLESLYLNNKISEPKYAALDDLVGDVQGIPLLAMLDQYEFPQLPQSMIDLYDLEASPSYVPSSATDFTQYLTQRWIDTSISFELEPENVQDYLRYLGERAKAIWSSN